MYVQDITQNCVSWYDNVGLFFFNYKFLQAVFHCMQYHVGFERRATIPNEEVDSNESIVMK